MVGRVRRRYGVRSKSGRIWVEFDPDRNSPPQNDADALEGLRRFAANTGMELVVLVDGEWCSYSSDDDD